MKVMWGNALQTSLTELAGTTPVTGEPGDLCVGVQRAGQEHWIFKLPCNVEIACCMPQRFHQVAVVIVDSQDMEYGILPSQRIIQLLHQLKGQEAFLPTFLQAKMEEIDPGGVD